MTAVTCHRCKQPVAVMCPRCQQPVVPNPDGTLPGHQIHPGPGRSPMCRFRGIPTEAEARS